MSTTSFPHTDRQVSNPYPGIRPFEDRDADRFFGRDEEIEQLLRLVSSERFVTVLGVSGSGKSSLVRAGIIPVLRMGMAENVGARWRVVTMTPGGGPLANLRQRLHTEFPGAPSLSENWPQTSFALVNFAQSALSPGESLLVFVDQFEELFAFRKDSAARDGGNEAALFVNLLLNAAGQREAPVYIALAMRSDYLGESAQFRGLPEAMNDGHYLVPRMTRQQQQEAIERPLSTLDAVMHPALVQRLLNESADDPDHLPVLQHLLKRLWEKWAEPGNSSADSIGFDEYKGVGGWEGALDTDAEGVLAGFTELGDEPGIRRLFQWITDRGTGAQPVRRPAAFSELAAVTKLEEQRLRDVIAAFQERGLLRGADDELRDDSRIDLPHESVAWQWKRLNSWIDEEAESAARLRFIRESADKSIVLTGSALREGLDLKQRMSEFPLWRDRCTQDSSSAKAIISWIDSSQRMEQRNRRRRWWTLATITAGILGAALLFVWQAAVQKRQAEARELAAWSGASLNEDPERSLILGMYSWGKQRTMVPSLAQFLHDAALSSLVRLTLRGHQNSVYSIAWSSDGSRLATASRDKTAKVWEAGSGRELLTLRGHQNFVNSIAWSPDGSRLATASADKTAKVWDAGSGRELLTLGGHQDAVFSIAWSPDGSRLATASWDKTAKVWEAGSGRELLTLSGHQSFVLSIAWSPDGSRLATASQDKTGKVWEAGSGRELLTLRGHQDTVSSIAWSPDGSRLATASFDKTEKVWEAGSGQVLLTLRGHQNSVYSIAWSPDGSRLATASGDSTAKVREAGSGRELLTLRGHQNTVNSIAWSPDGNRLATASWDSTAKVWEAGSGRELPTLRGHQAAVGSIAWSPDGSRLATASADEMAKVWEAGSGRELLTLRGHQNFVNSIAWSPDGRRLATASEDKTAKVWEAGSGRELLTLRGHQDLVGSIAWSPDGSRLATASRDNTAKVWEAASGQVLLILRGHQDTVSSIAWSPDGSRLATASWDKMAKVWEAGTGRELLTLRGHQDTVNNIAWVADGKRLATAGDDRIAQVYAIDETQLLRLVRSRITRDLTEDECRRYFETGKCPPLPAAP